MDLRSGVKRLSPLGAVTLPLPSYSGKSDDPGTWMKVVSVLASLLIPAVATADAWLVAETPAAVSVSDAQARVFRPGVMPAVGAYADNGWFALGVRLRAGILRDGAAPGDNVRDPGVGGLTTTSVAARLLGFGGWVEGAIGGGLTGDDLVPAAEVGIGWAFDVGGVELGPSVRYAHVASTNEMSTLGSASLLLVGVDFRFGRERTVRPARRWKPAPPPIAAPAPQLAIDRDHDPIVEREPSCAELAEGCTFATIVVVDDRIVLDERVLFDLDRARVKTAGRTLVRAIADLWRANPEWQTITIEGHADVRGSDAYNLELSTLRAQRVREVFVAAGADPARVEAAGFGRARPRDPGSDEAAHQRNRRVEFVIHRRVEEIR